MMKTEKFRCHNVWKFPRYSTNRIAERGSVSRRKQKRGVGGKVAVTLYKDITQIIMIVNILACVLLKF